MLQVSVADGALGPALLAGFQVVVMIDAPLEVQLEVNEFCHSKVSNNEHFLHSSYLVPSAQGLRDQSLLAEVVV